MLGKFDHTCFTYNGYGYAAGGWNVDFIGLRPNKTEKYVHNGREWKTLDNSHTELPDILRSSGYAVLNNKPALIGGVSCMIDSGGHTTCTKDSTVYTMQGTNDSNYKWVNSTFRITVPRSSHLVLTVPVTTKFGCKQVPQPTTASPTTAAAAAAATCNPTPLNPCT